MPPIYEYHCTPCNITTEEFLLLSESNKDFSLCETCGRQTHKIISASYGYVKGSDTPVKQ